MRIWPFGSTTTWERDLCKCVGIVIVVGIGGGSKYAYASQAYPQVTFKSQRSHHYFPRYRAFLNTLYRVSGGGGGGGISDKVRVNKVWSL